MFIFKNYSLSLSVTTRMTTNNDVPMLICQLLNVKPWIKLENNKKYIFQGRSNHYISNQLFKNYLNFYLLKMYFKQIIHGK